MIDHIGRVNMDYMVRLANDPTWASEEQEKLLDWNKRNGAVYAGEPIPCPIKPHFISTPQKRIMQSAVRNIASALNKFTDYWLQSDALQEMWGVTAEEMELYQVDPGYDGAIQIARFDGFLQDYSIKFLEFNCDSPGGSGYADVIHRGFLDMFERNSLGSKHYVSERQRLDSLLDTLLACYEDWRLRREEDERPEKPYIVVSDWRDVGTVPDIEITIAKMRERGYAADFVDPRDIEERGDGLYVRDRRVDLLYKRVIVKELVQDEAAGALARAYKKGQVCMVNSPRSVIVGNKKIMAALHRHDVQALLNNEERKAVRDHVPWTAVLADDKALFEGFKVNLADFVIDNKDKLVLKAAQSYGGKDVMLGFESSDEEWADLVKAHLNDNAWVVQQLVTIPKELFPDIRDGTANMKLLNVNINPLAFGGEYSGAMSRVSQKNVINVSYGGGLVPAMTIEPKEAPQ